MKKISLVCCALLLLSAAVRAQNDVTSVESQKALVSQYCAGCHNEKLKSGGFNFADLDIAHPELKAEQAEKVIRKLRAGMMPPPNARRPDATNLKAFATSLEARIDAVASKEVRV